MDEIKAYNENHEEQSKAQIVLLHKQAQWMAIGVNNPKKFPSLHQEFPDIFTNIFTNNPEPEQKKGKKKKSEKWELEKMQMALYAAAFNKNRKEKGYGN